MKICPKCNKEHDKNGQFCSRTCANSKKWSEEDKIKKSLAARNSEKAQKAHLLRRTLPQFSHCLSCGKSLDGGKRNRKTCGSEKCIEELRKKSFCETARINKKCGGVRENSGRSYSGYYKGFYCGSTYELAFLIWNLDNGIKISRCDKIFEYEGGRKYFPDFEIEGKIFEIKGFHTKVVSLKEAAVVNSGTKYEILYKSDLDPMIQYVRVKYGVKNLYDLYDKEIVPRYIYTCITCGAEIKTQIKRNTQYVFCGRKCIRTQKFIKKIQILSN